MKEGLTILAFVFSFHFLSTLHSGWDEDEGAAVLSPLSFHIAPDIRTHSPRTILASSVSPGYDPTNATQCFVNAIKSARAGDTVMIDCKLGTTGIWNLEGRHPNWFDGNSGIDKVADNLTIIFEEGVTLKAIDSTYDDKSGLDMLLRLENITGWKIYGYGAKFEMDKTRLPSGEDRNAIALYDCSDITIEGLEVDGSGGDGIYIGTRTTSGFSKNITVRNVNFQDHRRQGATIISAQNVLFENVKCNATLGRPPASGLDLEPNYRSQRLTGIRFQNVEFARNGYSGILFALTKLNNTTIPLDVEFNGIYITDNWQEPGSLNSKYKKAAIVMGLGGGGDNAIQGTVTYRNVLIKNEKFDGLYTLKHHDSYALSFNDLVIENVGIADAEDARNAIHTSRYNYNSPTPAVGNISFNGLLIRDDRSVPFWKMEGDSNDGWIMADLRIQNALVVTPSPKNAGIYNMTEARKGPGTFLSYQSVTSAPNSTLHLEKSSDKIIRGSRSSFTITRTAKNIAYPLPVEYEISGTADNMDDYDLLHGYVIIAANQNCVEIPVSTRIKKDQDETLTITLKNTTNYSLGNSIRQTMQIVSDN